MEDTQMTGCLVLNHKIGKMRYLLSFFVINAVFCVDLVFAQAQVAHPVQVHSYSFGKPTEHQNSPKPQYAPLPTPYAQNPAPPVQGTATEKISIEQISAIAVANHPAIAQAARQVEAYQGSWVQSGLKENPMVGFIADEMSSDNDAGRQGVTFSQEIVPRRKRDARQGVDSAEQNAARKGLQIQQQKVMNDATIAGYRLLIAQNKELLAQELLEICEKVAIAAYNLSEIKEVSKTDYLQARIEFNQAQIALNDVQLEREAASKEITILIGAPVWAQYEITDSLEHLPLDLDENEIYQQLVTQSPQIQRARAELNAARARLKKECQEAGVNISTEGNLLYNTNEKQTEVTVGISVPLRVYNKNQGNIMKANSELLAAASNVERVEKALQSQFQSQIAQFKTAQRRVQLYQEKVLTEVDESLRLIMQSYQQGESSYIELLSSQRTMFNARLEYMDNVGMLVNSRAMICGYLLQGAYDKPE